jgi:hypothetical protein
VKSLLEVNDQIEELQFEMRQSGHPEYAKLLGAVKNSQTLKKLVITVALKGELIDLLNKNIGSKDANLRQLQITFANP